MQFQALNLRGRENLVRHENGRRTWGFDFLCFRTILDLTQLSQRARLHRSPSAPPPLLLRSASLEVELELRAFWKASLCSVEHSALYRSLLYTVHELITTVCFSCSVARPRWRSSRLLLSLSLSNPTRQTVTVIFRHDCADDIDRRQRRRWSFRRQNNI